MIVPHFTVHHSDALAILQGVPSASAALCLTDPPYSALEKHRARGTTTRLVNAWFPVLTDEQIGDVLAECYRVLAQDTHAYVFINYEGLEGMLAQVKRAGFTIAQLLVWNRRHIGMGYHYRGKYEFIVMAEKGTGRATADPELADIIDGRRVMKGRLYPTQKPVPVLRTLVHQSSRPGEVVLDPFCGSGATGEAALLEGCDFIGIDVSEEAVRISRARLEVLTATAG